MVGKMKIDFNNIRKLEEGEAYDVRQLSFEEKMEVFNTLADRGNRNIFPETVLECWQENNAFKMISCLDNSLHPRRADGYDIEKVLTLPTLDEIQVGDIVVYEYTHTKKIFRVKGFKEAYIEHEGGYSTIEDSRKATLEDFYNTKIKVDTPSKSTAFQKLIFGLGGCWLDGEQSIWGSNYQLLLINKNGELSYMSKHRLSDFNESENKEIFFDDLFPDWKKDKADTTSKTSISWEDDEEELKHVIGALKLSMYKGIGNKCPICQRTGEFGSIVKFMCESNNWYLVCGWCGTITKTTDSNES